MKDDLKHSSQVSIKNRLQASTILLRLFSMLYSPSILGLKEDKKEYVVFPDYAWMLSCLSRIWNVIAPEVTHSVSNDVSTDGLVTFLDTVRNASSRLAETKSESSAASWTFILLAQAITTLLLVRPVSISTFLNKSICLGLFELASLNQRAPNSLYAFNEHISPALLEIKDDHDRFDSFDEDLQVRLKVSP